MSELGYQAYQCVSQRRWWRRLDGLHFIPRSAICHHVPSFNPAPYVRALEELVSPVEVLCPNQEAVAWTQRGFFHSQPDPRLLVVDLVLDVPSVTSVVSNFHGKLVVTE